MATNKSTIFPAIQSTLRNLKNNLCSFGAFGECEHLGKSCSTCGRKACEVHGERCLDCNDFNCEDCAALHGMSCEKATGEAAGSGSDPVHDVRRDACAELSGVRQ